MKEAPRRVGEPVFAEEARATVETDHGGYAAGELFVVALRHAEGRHHSVDPAFYRGFDHRARVFQPLDGAVGARMIHRHDQSLPVSSEYRCSSHLYPLLERQSCTRPMLRVVGKTIKRRRASGFARMGPSATEI